jgi:hypothetical protein
MRRLAFSLGECLFRYAICGAQYIPLIRVSR